MPITATRCRVSRAFFRACSEAEQLTMRYLHALLAGVALCAILLPAPSCASQSVKKLETPAFSSVPELKNGYNLLYEQKFPEARAIFEEWAEKNPTEPFGQVSIGFFSAHSSKIARAS